MTEYSKSSIKSPPLIQIYSIRSRNVVPHATPTSGKISDFISKIV